MSYTRRQWFHDLLVRVGNSDPTDLVLDWGVNWTAQEIDKPGDEPKYNLLATEKHLPGSTDFNTAGVQNFQSYHDGIEANALVLEQLSPAYPALLTALRNNNEVALGFHGFLMDSHIERDLMQWSGGGYNGNWFHNPPTQERLDQQFAGDVSPADVSEEATEKLEETTEVNDLSTMLQAMKGSHNHMGILLAGLEAMIQKEKSEL